MTQQAVCFTSYEVNKMEYRASIDAHEVASEDFASHITHSDAELIALAKQSALTGLEKYNKESVKWEQITLKEYKVLWLTEYARKFFTSYRKYTEVLERRQSHN